MNAYELAEKMHKAVNADEKHLTLDIEAMIMLRQQADRIAELERLVSDMIYEKSSGVYDKPQTKPLSDEEIPILTILQSAHSVRLGDAIYESDAEYEKLKKIVVAAVKWTQERHGIK